MTWIKDHQYNLPSTVLLKQLLNQSHISNYPTHTLTQPAPIYQLEVTYECFLNTIPGINLWNHFFHHSTTKRSGKCNVLPGNLFSEWYRIQAVHKLRKAKTEQERSHLGVIPEQKGLGIEVLWRGARGSNIIQICVSYFIGGPLHLSTKCGYVVK